MITVNGDMEVKYVARLMVTQSIRRIVVVENNELAGIISMNDIVSAIIAMVDED